jgi:hypothetical protein
MREEDRYINKPTKSYTETLVNHGDKEEIPSGKKA